MDQVVQNAGDLPALARSAVESLMGHSLRDDQQEYIVALDASSEPPADQRRQAWEDVQAIIGELHAKVRDSGTSGKQLERAIDQACDEVRYGK